jgi:predicted nucleic acid-binding protein
MTKRSFPDVNVWFALAVGDHPHHPPALTWWNEESSLAGFSRLTQLGLMRLLTTASTMGGQPLTNTEALARLRRFSIGQPCADVSGAAGP